MVAEIQKKVIKRSERHRVSRLFHSRDDKEMITGWKSDLNSLLQVFNVRSACHCLIVTNSRLFRPNLL